MAGRYINPDMVNCPEMIGIHTDGCLKCGGTIPPRRRSWCDEHPEWWARNHYWTAVRWQALQTATVYDIRRSEQCIYWHVKSCRNEEHYHRPQGVVCAFCGGRGAEVDHIIAANGTHAEKSCLHHQENVRVLCVQCHKARTKVQAKDRAIERKMARVGMAQLI